MVKILKSKENNQSENRVDKIAEELFQQITEARDKAKSGGIVDEQIFNDRLNSMFAAGYLIGYVDEYLAELFSENAAKKQNAEAIFETMFPGSGMNFVKSKLITRKQVATLSETSENYQEVAEQCTAFDKGMADAQSEVIELVQNKGPQPRLLKEFLLLGEI
jgi:hypothetical protein